MQALTSRLGITDFLGTLPAGFLVIFAFSKLFPVESLDLAIPSTQASEFLESVLIVLASFFIGSVFRAIPVRWMDVADDQSDDRFPYPDLICRGYRTLETHNVVEKDAVLEKLCNCAKGETRIRPAFLEEVFRMLLKLARRAPAIVKRSTHGETRVPDQNEWMIAYDYWKSVLSHSSSEAYNHVKTLEAKSRFFAGIAWSFLTIAMLSIFGLPFDWRSSIVVFVSSVTLFGASVYALQRARREEVTETLWEYLAHRQKSKPEKKVVRRRWLPPAVGHRGTRR